MDSRINRAGQQFVRLCIWMVHLFLLWLLVPSGVSRWCWDILIWFLGSSLWLVVKTGEAFFGLQFLATIYFYIKFAAFVANGNGNVLNQGPAGQVGYVPPPPPAYDHIQPPAYVEGQNEHPAEEQG